MKLITEIMADENIDFFTEENAKGEKSHYIKGIFMQAEQKNRNGRIYPKEVLNKEVYKYIGNYVEQNRAFGELGHPDGPVVNLERVSHMIKELKEDGNNWVGKVHSRINEERMWFKTISILRLPQILLQTLLLQRHLSKASWRAKNGSGRMV
jgi:hypothetical protein